MASVSGKTRILVLGASGKLGRMVRSVCQSEDFQHVDLIPVFRSGSPESGGIVWHPGQSMEVFPDVDAVLALWGTTRGSTEVLAQNTQLAIVATELAVTLQARCVVHCSSAAVYRPGPDLLPETAELDPPSEYGRAKLAMERAISQSAAPVRSVILRIGSVAGAESLFASLARGNGITLDRFKDGLGPKRSYISPQDLTRAILALIAHAEAKGVYNIGARHPVGMHDIAMAAGQKVTWKEAPEGAVQHVMLDTAKLSQICDLGPDSADPAKLVAGAKASGVWP